MNNQQRNLANTLPDTNNDEDKDEDKDEDDNKTINTEALEDDNNADELNEDNLEEKPKENIKSVELTGKDAVSLNQNNPTKKPVSNTSPSNNSNNSNNLTKKKNNNPTRNITQKQSPNINVATDDGDNNLMRNLNKVAMNLLNHQIVMKLFHFQTELYGAHKASDGYLEKFATTMDKFLEIAQGIYGRLTIKKFKLEGSSHNDENIIKHIEGIIMLLRTGIDDVLANYTDLINVRDELVGDAEQLKYLLSFK